MREHTQGEMERVKGFQGCYEQVVIDKRPIAILQERGITKREAIANSERFVLCWNRHDDLMSLLDNVIKGVDIDQGSAQRLWDEINNA